MRAKYMLGRTVVACRLLMSLAVVLVMATVSHQGNAATYELSAFQDKFTVDEIVPGADRLGAVEGDPPSAVAYTGDEVAGYVFLNSSIVNATGYSGKPIHVVIGMDTSGVITGVKMVKHWEPIVLIGIPVSKIDAFNDKYVGLDILSMIKAGTDEHEIDIVSGATVTVMVIDDTIIRSAIKVARARGIGGLMPLEAAKPTEIVEIKDEPPVMTDWQTLLGDGSVRHLVLSVGDVTEAFRKDGKETAAVRAESNDPDELFIDLFAASASVPTIARSLLGKGEYANLLKKIKPGESAILLASTGLYSFKGSGYVRGGIFDRFQLIQGDINVRFRDRIHKRLGAFEAEGSPKFKDVDLFYIPADSGFDPAKPWRIQLLAGRHVGPIKKEFITFDLHYTVPDPYLKRTPIATSGEAAGTAQAPARAEEGMPLWQRIWLKKIPDIAVLVLSLGVLTAIFFFQDWFVKRPKLTDYVRLGFLTFTVVWIGFYAQAQLSIVNVLTFAGSLISGFKWDFFLMEPLIFILWGSVAASLLFWGRGVYCGWLCPFGALQELLNRIAKWARIPQFNVPFALHERLWPVKYILFLALFGVSFYSFELAEQLAEVEPFKTAIILKFVRTWPYVLFAVALLAVGLFVERFYCRYICPLGGALGVPGRMSMNRWLRRHKECGSPCHRCAKECMVQAIHPNGEINPNECLQCLHCQTLYFDEHKCPPMIQKRLRRERRLAIASKSMSPPARKGAGATGQEAAT